MGRLSAQVRGEIERNRETPLFQGQVRNSVSSSSQGIYVDIPDPAGRAKPRIWGPMRWVQQVIEGTCDAEGCTGEAHIRYPQAGDDCLVGLTHTGEPWLVGYWPPGWSDDWQEEDFET